jgi:hypothetical protein
LLVQSSPGLSIPDVSHNAVVKRIDDFQEVVLQDPWRNRIFRFLAAIGRDATYIGSLAARLDPIQETLTVSVKP